MIVKRGIGLNYICLNLIEEKMDGTFPRRRLISLTEKGKYVAKKLNEINMISTTDLPR